MILIVVKFKTKPEWSDRWLDLVHDFTEATRAEPGNLWFDWSRSTEDPSEFVLVEAFHDDGAVPHVTSEHFKRAIDELPIALRETPEIINTTIEGASAWSRMAEMTVDAASASSADTDPAAASPVTWRRASGGPALDPRTVIHIEDAPLAERIDGSPRSPITLQPLTGPACDLAVLIFTFPPNYVGKVHWHPADTVYVVRQGQFIVAGEGTYEVGDIRWVKAGTAYGPESSGPEGCEVMLMAAGAFPLPTYDPAIVPPLR